MSSSEFNVGPVRLQVALEQWRLATPFRITGYVFETIDVVVVTLERHGQVGRGEAAGVYYRNDKPRAMVDQIEALRGPIEAGLSREFLRTALPNSGAG
jgi:L-Ala-D/L-Glu epimerase / N-acetyl-D-glutamate racemase